jgi:hypothetical protein
MRDGSKDLWVILHVDSGFLELEKVANWKGAHWRK